MNQWIRGLLPILLLGLLLILFFRFGPLGVFWAAFPPVEELTIERIVLPKPHQMIIHVTNGGPGPVTVAQVMVDQAYWQFRTERDQRTIPRLGSMKIYLPYPWVDGDAHEVTLVTSTGLTFSRTIEVATQTPGISWVFIRTFAMLGIYAGVIPVFLGLLWHPFLRELTSQWLVFFLSLTAGLLFFLAVDTFSEALETSASVPGAFQGTALITLGLTGALLLLFYIGSSRPAGRRDSEAGRRRIAWMIALGIGLHNLGEGLAIGSAYAIGEIALGTFLVVGFTLHNLTEGLGIVAPIAKDRPSLATLALMGLLAGGPTVVGTWIGGFSYSPAAVTLFLAIGAGAILQVLYEIGGLIAGRTESFWNGFSVGGFFSGLLIMYVTGLFVVA
ncbi:MAG TPA: ZIP family metal transporter [Acidobacteriota bacterium]|nr:ZIP family metal transporter [Acidobacteriota bacterium]